MQLLDVSVFNGGGNIAGFTNDNSYRLKSLINYAKKYSAYVQKCADNFGEKTLEVLDEYTENYGGLAGFKTTIDNNDNKIVTTNYWTWQGFGGYAKFYDELFHDFTPTDHDKLNIGNEYTLWTWKGDYLNLGAGGEIGIYKGTGDVVSTTMSEQLGVTMSMEIVAKDGTSVVNYSPEGDSWWLTGWNPNIQGMTSKDLTLKGTLDFSANEKTKRMYDELKFSYKRQKQSDLIKGNINFNDDYILNYVW